MKPFPLSSKSRKLSKEDVVSIIEKFNFFEKNLNQKGSGINNNFAKLITNDGIIVIVDQTTKLMWQQRGSGKIMTIKESLNWVDMLNHKKSFFLPGRYP